MTVLETLTITDVKEVFPLTLLSISGTPEASSLTLPTNTPPKTGHVFTDLKSLLDTSDSDPTTLLKVTKLNLPTSSTTQGLSQYLSRLLTGSRTTRMESTVSQTAEKLPKMLTTPSLQLDTEMPTEKISGQSKTHGDQPGEIKASLTWREERTCAPLPNATLTLLSRDPTTCKWNENAID